jgi:hypothetical protein
MEGLCEFFIKLVDRCGRPWNQSCKSFYEIMEKKKTDGEAIDWLGV